jgi:hypothetical protein
MLRNDTCELRHTNSYVYNQSYKFVLRNTKNYFPPEPKKLTQHHNCMVLQVQSSIVCTTKTYFPPEPKLTQQHNWKKGSSSPRKAWAGSSSPREASVCVCECVREVRLRSCTNIVIYATIPQRKSDVTSITVLFLCDIQ